MEIMGRQQREMSGKLMVISFQYLLVSSEASFVLYAVKISSVQPLGPRLSFAPLWKLALNICEQKFQSYITSDKSSGPLMVM